MNIEQSHKHVTRERLVELFDYDSDTGIFTRKKSVSGGQKGKAAGSKNDRGYVFIMIDGRIYRAHRLAWLWEHGRMPELSIDHINRVTDDNRIINLREATRSQNSINTRTPSTNKSGHRGVSYVDSIGKWKAQIYKDKKPIYLGVYKHLEDAAKAYHEAAKSLHGEFACTNIR